MRIKVIVVGITLLSFLFCAIYALQSSYLQKASVSNAPDGEYQNVQGSLENHNSNDGMKQYVSDVLGISFVYPSAWGEVEVRPAHVTKVDALEQKKVILSFSLLSNHRSKNSPRVSLIFTQGKHVYDGYEDGSLGAVIPKIAYVGLPHSPKKHYNRNTGDVTS